MRSSLLITWLAITIALLCNDRFFSWLQKQHNFISAESYVKGSPSVLCELLTQLHCFSIVGVNLALRQNKMSKKWLAHFHLQKYSDLLIYKQDYHLVWETKSHILAWSRINLIIGKKQITKCIPFSSFPGRYQQPSSALGLDWDRHDQILKNSLQCILDLRDQT